MPFEAEVLSGDPRLRPSAREAALAHRFRIPPELRRQAPLALLLTFTSQGLPERGAPGPPPGPAPARG